MKLKLLNEDKNFTAIIAYALCFFSFIPTVLAGIEIGGINFSAYRIIIVIALLVCCFSIKFLNFPLKRANVFTICFVFWVLVSCAQLVISQNILLSLKYLLVLVFVAFVSFYMDIFVSVKRKNIKIILNVIILAALVNYVFLLQETFTGDYFNFLDDYYISARNAFGMFIPIGYLGNPNNVGLFCFCTQFVMCLRFAIEDSKWKRCLVLLCCALNVYIWLATGSRTVYLGIVLLAVLAIMLLLRKKAFLTTVAIIPPLIIVGIILIFASGKFFTGSDMTRLTMIKEGIGILFTKSYGLGVGVGNVENFMPNNWNIHNFVVEVLVSGGIIVFSLLTYVYYRTVSGYIRDRYKANTKQKRLVSAISAIFMLVFLFASLAPSSCMQLDYVWMFFILQILIKKYIKAEEN